MNMNKNDKKNKNEVYEKPAFEKVKTGEDIIRSSTAGGNWTEPGDDGKSESGSADIFNY